MKKTAVIGICGKSIFLECNTLPKKGESILANNLYIEPGGKGTNAATTINRLGGNVSILVSLSNDEYGLKCRDFFKEEKLNVTFINKNAKTDSAVIMSDLNGDNCVSLFIDQNNRLTPSDILSFKEEIVSSNYILLTGELTDDVLLTISELSSVNNKIIFNPSPIRSFPIDFLKKVWLFTSNEMEYDNLIKLIKPSKTIVTLGSKGARLIDDDRITDFNTRKVEVVNTTGAGDVFNGALCYALMNDYEIEDAIRFAIKASTYKVTHNYVLEGIPTLLDLKEFDKKEV